MTFEEFMDSEYPEGSGNAKGSFYDDDMRAAFETGHTGTHRGIRLRISIPAGRLLDVDSDMLHNMSMLDTGQDWHEVLKTVDGLLIEARAVMLPDDYPDD